jgi:hypothetical protein
VLLHTIVIVLLGGFHKHIMTALQITLTDMPQTTIYNLQSKHYKCQCLRAQHYRYERNPTHVTTATVVAAAATAAAAASIKLYIVN